MIADWSQVGYVFNSIYYVIAETADCKAGGIDHVADDVDREIHAMSIPTLINNLADYNKLNHDVTNILDNVRTTVVKRVSLHFIMLD